MNHQFHFGLEAEFLLADSRNFKPLWYRDVTFQQLDHIFTSVSLEGIPDLKGLDEEPPHQKIMPFLVEGYGIPDEQMKIVDAYPKGVEIRTPVCHSISQTLEVYSTLHKRLTQALEKDHLSLVALSHHPVASKFRGPQNKRRHDFWMWAQEVMTTYGPDINVSFPQDISRELFSQVDKLHACVNYYAPAMAALSVASPFFEGQPWLIKGQRGKSYRTFKRSVIAPAIELHQDENSRIEFKVFEMSRSLSDFEAYFHLVLALFLSINSTHQLKGRSSDQERIYDLGAVSRFGLLAEGVDRVLGELFEKAEKTLPLFGFKTDSLKVLHNRFEKKEHIADEMLNIYDTNQSIEEVLKVYSKLC